MLLVSLGLYTAFMASVWAFFLVAKIHVYKFRDYSPHIRPITRFLGIILLAMTLIGYGLVWSAVERTPSAKKVPQVTVEDMVSEDSGF